MDWMWAAFWAWIGWNILAPMAILIVILIFYLLMHIPTAVRQYRCSHSEVRETPSCDAVCRDCGKGLGFIGAWRENAKKIAEK